MTILEAEARDTFSGCARFYDRLTAHHDYEAVARMIEQMLSWHGRPGRRMLDVACGTGKSFLPLARRGYDVTACDVTPEMLAQARANADADVELVAADMRALPTLGEFDFVTCIDEPINYLLKASDVERTFASVAGNLRPGGLFLFDLRTLQSFQTVFARDECYEQEGWFFAWRGHGDADADAGVCSSFTIEAFTQRPDGSWLRLSNQHVQRHYPADEVQAMLARAGLERVGVYGIAAGGVLVPDLDEQRHSRFFHVARKPYGTTRR